jgi:hypothetical protein
MGSKCEHCFKLANISDWNNFDLKAVVHDCKVIGSTTEDGDQAKPAGGT